MRLSSFAIHHPAIIIIVGLAVIVFGILAMSSLNQEFIPDVSIPTIMIVTRYPGVEAETVEGVTETIEDSMITLQGLKTINSESRNSVSVVTLEFSNEVDPYLILPDVRANIDRVKGSLPTGVEGEPYAFIGGSGMLSIYSFAIISDRDPDMLFRLVNEEITPSIARIAGTASVNAYGGREQEVSIILDTTSLRQLGISVMQVYQILNASNISMPAGNPVYRDSRVFMNVEGRYTSLQELRDLVIDYRNASYIYLKDVADIQLAYPEEELNIEVDGRRAIVVDVTKRADGNTLDITDEIESLIERYEQQYQGVIEFLEIQNDSTMIRRSLQTTVRSGIIGAVMAVLVILIFIGDVRATLIIGVSIPLSIVFTFIGMKLAGQSMNILSLSGLIVALGMVVDSSIVILENIFRHEQEGLPILDAAEQGAHEVGGAVFASGTTTIAVFLPLLSLSGIIGIILTDISLTIVFALAASLLVSLVVVPFLATHLDIEGMLDREDTPGRKFDLMKKIESGYRKAVSWAIDHKVFIMIAAVLILIASVAALSVLGVVFIPSADTADFYIYLKFPQGYDLLRSHAKVSLVRELLEEEVPEIEHLTFFTGFSSEFSRSYATLNRAYAKVILIDQDERERSVREIIRELQILIPAAVPDVDVVVENGGFDKLLSIASGGSGFQVELYGNDMERLYDTARTIQEHMIGDAQVHKSVLNIQEDQETLITDLALDHMGKLGISAQEAAFTSRILFGGVEIGTFDDDRGLEYPIVLSSELSRMPLTMKDLEQVSIPAASGEAISFDSFSETRIDTRVSSVHHKNRMKAIVITGYTNSDDTTELRDRMEQYLFQTIEPSIIWEISGSSSLLSDSFSTLLLVLLIAVFLVYMVMVIQFERFVQPLIIMLSIPFCFIGVILGLLIFGSDLSLIAFLGIIALAGIVVNNAIVLIDRMNHGEEPDLKERVVNASSERLRPVLMTTLTTFFGVLPMAMSSGSGSEIYAPLGQAIAGGLLSSTVITLIIIPVLYTSIERRRYTDEN